MLFADPSFCGIIAIYPEFCSRFQRKSLGTPKALPLPHEIWYDMKRNSTIERGEGNGRI